MTTDKSLDALTAARESMRQANESLLRMDAREDARDKIERDSPDTLADKVKNMFIAARRLNKVYDAAADLYEKVSPYAGWLIKPALWTAGKLKDGFTYAAYDHENGKLKLDKDGDPIFSPGRLGKAFVIAVGLGLAANVGMQATYYHATHFSETVYVNGGKSQIEKGELYQFSGCESLPCGTDSNNGKYYQIEKSLIFPTLLYPERDVFAYIPQEGICKVEGYGIYSKELKPIFKWAEWYQNVDNVSCRPFTAQEKEAAIASGFINQTQMPKPTMEMTP